MSLGSCRGRKHGKKALTEESRYGRVMREGRDSFAAGDMVLVRLLRRQECVVCTDFVVVWKGFEGNGMVQSLQYEARR